MDDLTAYFKKSMGISDIQNTPQDIPPISPAYFKKSFTPVQQETENRILNNNPVASYVEQWEGKQFKPGETERCADFVSTMLEESGQANNIPDYQHQVNVLELAKYGNPVDYNGLQPGDTVFFDKTYMNTDYTHTGVYVGNGDFIHKSTSDSPVRRDTLASGYWKDKFNSGRRYTEFVTGQQDQQMLQGANAKEMSSVVRAIGRQFFGDKDTEIFVNQLQQESGLKPYDSNGNILTSSAGAIGIAQFMPDTLQSELNSYNQETGSKLTIEDYKKNPRLQILLGARHMQGLLKANNGDWATALAAYNSGQGGVQTQKQMGYAYDETKNYVANILNISPEDANSMIVNGGNIKWDPEQVTLDMMEGKITFNDTLAKTYNNVLLGFRQPTDEDLKDPYLAENAEFNRDFFARYLATMSFSLSSLIGGETYDPSMSTKKESEKWKDSNKWSERFFGYKFNKFLLGTDEEGLWNKSVDMLNLTDMAGFLTQMLLTNGIMQTMKLPGAITAEGTPNSGLMMQSLLNPEAIGDVMLNTFAKNPITSKPVNWLLSKPAVFRSGLFWGGWAGMDGFNRELASSLHDGNSLDQAIPHALYAGMTSSLTGAMTAWVLPAALQIGGTALKGLGNFAVDLPPAIMHVLNDGGKYSKPLYNFINQNGFIKGFFDLPKSSVIQIRKAAEWAYNKFLTEEERNYLKLPIAELANNSTDITKSINEQTITKFNINTVDAEKNGIDNMIRGYQEQKIKTAQDLANETANLQGINQEIQNMSNDPQHGLSITNWFQADNDYNTFSKMYEIYNSGNPNLIKQQLVRAGYNINNMNPTELGRLLNGIKDNVLEAKNNAERLRNSIADSFEDKTILNRFKTLQNKQTQITQNVTNLQQQHNSLNSDQWQQQIQNLAIVSKGLDQIKSTFKPKAQIESFSLDDIIYDVTGIGPLTSSQNKSLQMYQDMLTNIAGNKDFILPLQVKQSIQNAMEPVMDREQFLLDSWGFLETIKKDIAKQEKLTGEKIVDYDAQGKPLPDRLQSTLPQEALTELKKFANQFEATLHGHGVEIGTDKITLEKIGRTEKEIANANYKQLSEIANDITNQYSFMGMPNPVIAMAAATQNTPPILSTAQVEFAERFNTLTQKTIVEFFDKAAPSLKEAEELMVMYPSLRDFAKQDDIISLGNELAKSRAVVSTISGETTKAQQRFMEPIQTKEQKGIHETLRKYFKYFAGTREMNNPAEGMTLLNASDWQNYLGTAKSVGIMLEDMFRNRYGHLWSGSPALTDDGIRFIDALQDSKAMASLLKSKPELAEPIMVYKQIMGMHEKYANIDPFIRHTFKDFYMHNSYPYAQEFMKLKTDAKNYPQFMQKFTEFARKYRTTRDAENTAEMAITEINNIRRNNASINNQDIDKIYPISLQDKSWREFIFGPEKYKGTWDHEARWKWLGGKAEDANSNATKEKVEKLMHEILVGLPEKDPAKALRNSIMSFHSTQGIRRMLNQMKNTITEDGRPLLEKMKGGDTVKTPFSRQFNIPLGQTQKSVMAAEALGGYKELGSIPGLRQVNLTDEAGRLSPSSEWAIHPQAADLLKEFFLWNPKDLDSLLGKITTQLRGLSLAGSPLSFLQTTMSNLQLSASLSPGKAANLLNFGEDAIRNKPELLIHALDSGLNLNTLIKNVKPFSQDLIRDANIEDLRRVYGMDEKSKSMIVNKLNGAWEGLVNGTIAWDHFINRRTLFDAIQWGQLGTFWHTYTNSIHTKEGIALLKKYGNSPEVAMQMLRKGSADYANLSGISLNAWWHSNPMRKVLYKYALTPQVTSAMWNGLIGALDPLLSSKALQMRSRFAHIPDPIAREFVQKKFRDFIGAGVLASFVFANLLNYGINGHSTMSNAPGKELSIKVGENAGREIYMTNPLFGMFRNYAKALNITFNPKVEDKWREVSRMMSSRLTTIYHLMLELGTGKTEMGQPIFSHTDAGLVKNVKDLGQYLSVRLLPPEFRPVEEYPYMGANYDWNKRISTAAGLWMSEKQVYRSERLNIVNKIGSYENDLRNQIRDQLVHAKGAGNPAQREEYMRNAYELAAQGIEVPDKLAEILRLMGKSPDNRLRLTPEMMENLTLSVFSPEMYELKNTPKALRPYMEQQFNEITEPNSTGGINFE